MLSAAEAEAIILSLVTPLDPVRDREMVGLSEATQRILAASVTSQLDIPHWDNSAMDGYAVRAEDCQLCSPEEPSILQIIEEIPAGVAPQQTLTAGQAARIFTGAMLPPGADTIVMQENTEQLEADQVAILKAPEPQTFVRRKGSYYQAGTSLLSAGIQLRAAEIAVLASAQCPQVPVYRQPRVAIFSTGDELVTPDQPLQAGQIVDSNQYALTSLVEQAGAIALPLGIVPDRPEALRATLEQACETADFILSSGGVSVGDYDYVDHLLRELQAKIHIEKVAVKPGKPLTVATLPRDTGIPALYFGLPGNPASAFVGFWRFMRPALLKFAGLAQGYQPCFVTAIAAQELRAAGQRETYVWGNLIPGEVGLIFQQAPGSKNSGNLINLTQTNALARIQPNEAAILAGEQVSVLVLGSLGT